MVACCGLGHDDTGVRSAVEVMGLAAVQGELAEIGEAGGTGLAGHVSGGVLRGGEAVADKVCGHVVGRPDTADELREPHGHVDVVGEVKGQMAGYVRSELSCWGHRFTMADLLGSRFPVWQFEAAEAAQ